VINNSLSVLHGYENAKSQRFWGHDLDRLGSRDVIGHVTVGLGVGTSLLVVNDDHASILHRYGNISLKVAFSSCYGRKVYCACPVSRDL